jgi:predicted RNase H-like nuclease (RuvC/YqgF family)
MRIVGIDPGNAGAIAIIDDDKNVKNHISLYDMPTLVTEGKARQRKVT